MEEVNSVEDSLPCRITGVNVHSLLKMTADVELI